jgi:hypothetical protein
MAQAGKHMGWALPGRMALVSLSPQNWRASNSFSTFSGAHLLE